MAKRLIIIGGGGHAKVVADLALKCGYEQIFFLDDAPISSVLGYPMIGNVQEANKFNDGTTEFIIAIGNNTTRKAIAQRLDVPWTTLIHPTAQIGVDVSIQEGTVIMANAVVNSCAKIGKHCIINTGAIIEHDNHLSDYVHVSPNVAIGGTVAIGECCHIGIGSSIINNVSICNSCTIGAGCVVVKNIEEHGTYVGIPARKIK